MAIGVFRPPKPQSNNSSLFQLGGMAAGAAIGGLPGAAAGGSLGGMAGGMLNKPQEETPQVEANALSRRMSKLDENPQIQLSQGLAALDSIQDPVERAQLAEPLIQAQKIARNYYAG